MTSLAFILGVLPLVFATGRRARRRGIRSARRSPAACSCRTFLNIVFIPVLYVVVADAAGSG